jgi:glycosyltransferase involved in cell wall biosynthesis
VRVAFNVRPLISRSLRGWNRYTVNLLAELPALGVELFLYTDNAIDESHLARLPAGSYKVRRAPPMRYLFWEQRWLPTQCRNDKVAVLHTPFNFGLPWTTHCYRVLTLHDAIGLPPLTAQLKHGVAMVADLQARWHHWVARTRAHKIITDSHYSKSDLVRRYRIAREKLNVVYLSASANFYRLISPVERARAREKYRLVRPYVFYLGGWERRKNLPFLLRAFAAAHIADADLVLGGGTAEQRQQLICLARAMGIEERVRLLEWIAEEDLPSLYAEAVCFVYPSSHEGFGLQLCEAMATGCPTFAARATCLPEVLGDGGETFSLETESELVALLRKVFAANAYRQELKQRAMRRARLFSWRHTAEATVKIYEQLVREKGKDALSRNPTRSHTPNEALSE